LPQEGVRELRWLCDFLRWWPLLLREADRRLGLTRTLASYVQDRCDPSRITHVVEEMLLFRMMAIGCGHSLSFARAW
jgi:hypothetical protein